MERIDGMVTDYDVTGVQDLVRGQVAIITALEQERAEMERREALLTALVTGYDNADANQCADARDAIDWIERP